MRKQDAKLTQSHNKKNVKKKKIVYYHFVAMK